MEYDGNYERAIPIEINTRYLIKKEIGKSAYGTVYLAIDKQTGEEYFVVFKLNLKSRYQEN